MDLTIAGFAVTADGFCDLRDHTDLLTKAPAEGDDFVSDGVPGATFRPKVRHGKRAMVGLLVRGRVNSAGVAHADAWDGIDANVAEIESTICDPSLSALVPLVLTYRSGRTRTGQVYCPSLSVGLHQEDRTGVAVAAVLEVIIPAGGLT